MAHILHALCTDVAGTLHTSSDIMVFTGALTCEQQICEVVGSLFSLVWA